MTQDRLRPSLLERVEEGDQKNIPLLLDLLYGDLMSKLNLAETQLKGRLSDQESRLHRAQESIKRLENCPCPVHRDPAHSCVILDVNEALGQIKLNLTEEVGKIKLNLTEEVGKIKVRLAWWGGTITAVIGAFHLAAYFWPWLRR